MKTTGLTLAEAVKSGRPFRRTSTRSGWGSFITTKDSPLVNLREEDILAEDYELSPKQTWTREEVEAIKEKLNATLVTTYRQSQVDEIFIEAGL
jgi:hypothetical protein